MATNETIELNTKKIETLAKVARLLGDQIREQSKRIDKLQEEFAKLNDQFKRTSFHGLSTFSDKEPDQAVSSPTQYLTSQKQPQMPEITNIKKEKTISIPIGKDKDKKELLQALKKIDDL